MNTTVAPTVHGRRLRVPAAMATLSALAMAAALAAPGTVAPTAAAEPAPVVAPADVVTHTGTWFSHGRTLELRPDGTGTLGVWVGAFDGTVLDLRAIPSRNGDTVVEVTDVRMTGAGGLAPSETPGHGALVTVGVGGEVPMAQVRWAAGPREMTADLCPVGLDAETMNRMHCGA